MASIERPEPKAMNLAEWLAADAAGEPYFAVVPADPWDPYDGAGMPFKIVPLRRYAGDIRELLAGVAVRGAAAEEGAAGAGASSSAAAAAGAVPAPGSGVFDEAGSPYLDGGRGRIYGCVLPPIHRERVSLPAFAFMRGLAGAGGSVTAVNHNAHLTGALQALLDDYEMRAKQGDEWREKNMKVVIEFFKRLPLPITTSRQLRAMISSMPDDVRTRAGCLGSSTVDKVAELLDTGAIAKLQARLADKRHAAIKELKSVWGIGPVKARMLAEPPHNFRSVADLQRAVLTQHRPLRDGRGNSIITRDIEVTLKHYADMRERIPRAEVDEIIDVVTRAAHAVYGRAVHVVCCGSYRRGKPTSGDVDILICPHKQGEPPLRLTPLVSYLVRERFIVFTLAKGGFDHRNSEALPLPWDRALRESGYPADRIDTSAPPTAGRARAAAAYDDEDDEEDDGGGGEAAEQRSGSYDDGRGYGSEEDEDDGGHLGGGGGRGGRGPTGGGGGGVAMRYNSAGSLVPDDGGGDGRGSEDGDGGGGRYGSVMGAAGSAAAGTYKSQWKQDGAKTTAAALRGRGSSAARARDRNFRYGSDGEEEGEGGGGGGDGRRGGGSWRGRGRGRGASSAAPTYSRGKRYHVEDDDYGSGGEGAVESASSLAAKYSWRNIRALQQQRIETAVAAAKAAKAAGGGGAAAAAAASSGSSSAAAAAAPTGTGGIFGAGGGGGGDDFTNPRYMAPLRAEHFRPRHDYHHETFMGLCQLQTPPPAAAATAEGGGGGAGAGAGSNNASSSSSAAAASAARRLVRRLDIKTYAREDMATAVLYFTGSDYFNRSMRHFVRRHSWTLSDRGLRAARFLDGNGKVKSREGPALVTDTEEEVFRALGVPYRPPQDRSIEAGAMEFGGAAVGRSKAAVDDAGFDEEGVW